MSDSLPPLPPTALVDVPHFTYTSEAMRAYASAAVAAERERCANLCDGMRDEDRPGDYAWTIRTEWAADSDGDRLYSAIAT